MLKFCSLVALAAHGNYIFRLENWNTGRVYVAKESDKPFFGLVCRGTGKLQISGENGNRFANHICKELGFGRKAEFIGQLAGYLKHRGIPSTGVVFKYSKNVYLNRSISK